MSTQHALACYFKLQFWFLSQNRLPWAHKTLYPMRTPGRAIDCKNNDCSYVTAMTYTFDIQITVHVLNMRLECTAMRFSTFSTISRGVLKCTTQMYNILYMYFMINSVFAMAPELPLHRRWSTYIHIYIYSFEEYMGRVPLAPANNIRK